MPLDQTLILRLDSETESQIEKIAVRNGLSKSALARFALEVVLVPRATPLFEVLWRPPKNPERSRDIYVVKEVNGDSKPKT